MTLLLFAAGCDQLDSDGNGIVDMCEDRFPPSIVLRNAEIFRFNDDDYTDLCYNGKVFSNKKQLFNFLDYQFPASDDYQSPSKLSVNISYASGQCENTMYTLTPYQNISDCDGYDPGDCSPLSGVIFENPLYGIPKNVTILQLDEVAPEVEYGFLPQPNSINIMENKTLFHYMLDTDGDQMRLNDARFFYNVTVSFFYES